MNKKKYNNDLLVNILFTIYLVFNFFIQEYAFFLWKYNVYSNLFISIILILRIQLCKLSYFLIFVLVTSYFLIQFFQQKAIYGFIEYFPLVIFSYALKEGIIKPKIITSVLVAILLYWLYLIFFINLQPENFGRSSRNTIGFTLLAINTLYYLSHYFRASLGSSSIVPAIIAAIFSVYAWGRAGMFFNNIFLFIIIYIKYKCYGLKIYHIGILFSPLIIFFDQTSVLINAIKIRWGDPLNDIRWLIYYDFLNSFDLIHLITGFEFQLSKIIVNYNYNIHNSYLQLIANNGIGGVILICLLLMSYFKYIIFCKYVFLGIVSPYLLIIFFESGGQSGAYLMVIAILILSLKSYEQITNEHSPIRKSI